MHRIIDAQPLSLYKIKVSFSDGIEGEVDLSDLVGKGVFASWNNPQIFFAVAVDPQTHTVAWPGGIDLCPDGLYEDIVRIKS